MDDMIITFPGGEVVNADFCGFTVSTDQPAPKGGNSAPAPFQLFLASIGTCAGIYALRFCTARNIPTQGLRIVQKMEEDAKTNVTRITTQIELPAGFPEEYVAALVRAVDLCKVKKHITNPPEFEVITVRPEPAPRE